MAHITFVHGIANKPPRDVLLEQWRNALSDNGGLNLSRMGLTSEMVYWADMFHATPARTRAGLESLGAADGSVDPTVVDTAWMDDINAEEAAFVRRLATETGVDLTLPPDPPVPPDPFDESGATPELLPPATARNLMRTFLFEVYHYLFDAEFTPRAGETFRIRRDVRARVLDALRAGAERPGPHILVGHSLGSVIAYDVLTADLGAPPVDGFLTLGSPLGLSEVQHCLKPVWTRRDGWPAARLGTNRWCNVSDGLDPVCGGLAWKIARDFLDAGRKRVLDVPATNEGAWRHSAVKYLRQQVLRNELRAMLR
jgi:hypothetical protein